MKPPRKPVLYPFPKSFFSRNFDYRSSSLSLLISQLHDPSRFNLFCCKFRWLPSINQNTNKFDTTRFHDSTNQPNNVSFRPHILDSVTTSKPIFKTFHVDQMAIRPAQNRPFSSSPSDPSNSDPIAAAATVNSPLESSPHIDAGSSIRKPISLWPGMYHSPVTNALWEARSSIFERLTNSQENSPTQNELISKTPSESRTSILYKFSDDYILREQYRNPWNEIRMGKLLEDLDALAGTISFKHCSSDDSSTRPLMLVTASVDKMMLRKPIQVDTDVTIAGAVTWVGRSSMEIQLEVTQSLKETSDPLESIALTANFTFVARDSKTGKSAPINQICPEQKKKSCCGKKQKKETN